MKFACGAISALAGIAVALACPWPVAAAATFSGPAVVAYVFPRGTALQPGQIDARKLTRINYAFANMQDGRMVVGSVADQQNFAALVALKRDNPELTVLVSVGGWAWSGGFSDASLTAESRRTFAVSVVDFLGRYHLDGLDVDWEYPGVPGASHAFRSEDKQNFTLLLQELRARFQQAEKEHHKRLYLTIAAGASDEYLAHTEMAKVQQYVDTVNLMAYDLSQAASDSLTGHQAPLFTDPAAPKKGSADASVHAFQNAGVPAAKIVLGVPFYGRAWAEVPYRNHGLFQTGKPPANDFIPYGAVAADLLGHGFERHWDAAASAPYLYSSEKRMFVSYDDAESLNAKCSYVLRQKLAGVMFWEYSGDPSGELLGVLHRTLKGANPTPAQKGRAHK